MIKNFFKIYLIFLTFFFTLPSYADLPRYLDFKLILNESVAGKKAQNFLKNKLEKGIKSIKDQEKNYRQKKNKLFNRKKL